MCAAHMNRQTGPRIQNEDHHVQANLAAAKATTHPIRNRNIVTAKLACFLNSLTPSLIRVVRRKRLNARRERLGSPRDKFEKHFCTVVSAEAKRSWPGFRMMCGDVAVKSETGKGSVFAVRLPGDATNDRSELATSIGRPSGSPRHFLRRRFFAFLGEALRATAVF